MLHILPMFVVFIRQSIEALHHSQIHKTHCIGMENNLLESIKVNMLKSI